MPYKPTNNYGGAKGGVLAPLGANPAFGPAEQGRTLKAGAPWGRIPGLSDMETDRPFEIVNLRKKCAWGAFFPQIDDCQRSVCHEGFGPWGSECRMLGSAGRRRAPEGSPRAPRGRELAPRCWEIARSRTWIFKRNRKVDSTVPSEAIQIDRDMVVSRVFLRYEA